MGGVIRWVVAGGEGLWLDELHTSWAIRGRLVDVLSRAADGNQAPLYFWLTWIPVRLFGESEFMVRSVSLLAGIGLMLAAPWVCWKWTRSSIAAVVVALLIAFNLDQSIYYGTEARPYGLLQLLSLIQAAVFVAAVRAGNGTSSTRRRPYWGLAILSSLLVYIHFTAVWIFVAEFLFVTIWLLVIRWRQATPCKGLLPIALTMILTMMLTMAICYPAMIQIIEVIGRKGNWESISSVNQFWKTQQLSLVVGIAIPAIGLFVFLMLEKRWLSRSTTRPLDFMRVGFVLLWAVIPTICIIALAWLEIAPIALNRYAQVGAVAIPLFGGIAIGQLSTKRGQAALALLVLTASIAAAPSGIYHLSRGQIPLLRFEDWKTPAEFVRENVTKRNQPILLFGNLIEDVDAFTNLDLRFQSYLEFPVHGTYNFETSHREIVVYPTATFSGFRNVDLQTIREQKGAWIIVRARRPFVEELMYELDRRLSEMVNRPEDSIEVTVMASPDSDVYLLSVDY